ncbi:MAG: intradiol ring-cleavage dioxygenase [Pseudomonadota bacterium]
MPLGPRSRSRPSRDGDRFPSRRQVLSGAGLILSIPAMAGLTSPARPVVAAQAIMPTPQQTKGPFYPDQIPLDSDNDLLWITGRQDPAQGHVTHLFGNVSNREGVKLAGLQVEIWQCDALGRYRHSRDPGARDDAFQGYGRTMTDEKGAYRFRTIKPVPYTGRAPHIHIAVTPPGERPFISQIYVKGEPLNRRDGLFRRLANDQARDALSVDFLPAPEIEPGALKARFDITMNR